MSELALIFVLIIISVLISILIVRKPTPKVVDSKPIPGPKASRILGKLLGNLEIFWSQRECFTNPAGIGFQLFIAYCKIYENEGIFGVRFGPFKRLVVFFSADTVEPLLTSSVHIDKAKEYFFAKEWGETGLLLSSGDKWRSRRKLLTPSFHFKILEDFVPVINGQLRQMMEIIDTKIGNRGIIDNFQTIITNCTLDIICETAMGIQINAQTDTESEYVQSIRKSLPILFNRFVSPWLWNDLVYKCSPSGREAMKIFRCNTSHSPQQTGDTKRRKAFLDALLSYHMDGQQIDEQGIREEVNTFMFEGHDTTSSALQFALLLIGLHPEAQNKIHEELDQIFCDDINREITLEDIKQMKYLEQTIKESLRLYPPVPLIGRSNREPFKVGQHMIPANTTCGVFLYMLHRDPKVFPRPEVFDPSRFDSSVHHSSDANAFTYVPFSAGPRNCIGQKFALLEEKAVLAAILRKYRIQSLLKRDQMEIDLTVVTKLKSNLRIEFENRYTDCDQ